MSTKSDRFQVVVLCEDSNHYHFVRGFLMTKHANATFVPRMPVPDRLTPPARPRSRDSKLLPPNTMMAPAGLGVPAVISGKIGDDEFGPTYGERTMNTHLGMPTPAKGAIGIIVQKNKNQRIFAHANAFLCIMSHGY